MQWVDDFLVLQKRPFRDSQEIVEGLSRTAGRISCVARRSRKNILQPPVLIKGRFRRSGQMETLSQPELLQAFLPLQANLQALLTAGFLGRLFLASLGEREPEDHIFELLLYLYLALTEGAPPKICGLWGQDRLLVNLGIGPELEACVSCGSEETTGYSPAEGGLLCNNCYSGDGFALNQESQNLARELRHKALSEIEKLTETALTGVGLLYKEHFIHHLGLSPKLFKRVLPPSRKEAP